MIFPIIGMSTNKNKNIYNLKIGDLIIDILVPSRDIYKIGYIINIDKENRNVMIKWFLKNNHTSCYMVNMILDDINYYIKCSNYEIRKSSKARH